MENKLLLSTAYLPPAEYFSLIAGSENIFIEREENYVKQSYRNRCYILSAHGPQLLSVPVLLGSVHKTLIKDIRIDYSKRWQQVHLRALKASYSSAPFFEFYFDSLEKIIASKNTYLLDLNFALNEKLFKYLNLNKLPVYTTFFEPSDDKVYDFRYKLSPKKKSSYIQKSYLQVFNTGSAFVPSLSIVDLLFNMGPGASGLL